jgi:hypothetical protein
VKALRERRKQNEGKKRKYNEEKDSARGEIN